MKLKYLFFIFLFAFTILTVSAEQLVLRGYVEKVPDAFFGTWRVVSQRIETNSPEIFQKKGLDLWNLSQDKNVINLSNPFSGASAQIEVQNVDKNRVEFTKKGKYGNKMLTDTVSISINGDNFSGSDSLKLETISDVDGSVIKTETAKYLITGERLAGQDVGNFEDK